MLVDMPLEELKKYKPLQTKKDDFLKFWEKTKKLGKIDGMK